MRTYDYSFLKDKVPGNLINISNIIYDLRSKEQVRRQGNEAVFQELQEIAIINSVRGSNAIEGIVTTEQRIRDIVQSGEAPITHDEKEILGYKAALDEIFQGYQHIDLRPETIRHLHATMLSATAMDAGNYKSDDNLIQEVRADGSRKIRFIPVRAFETEAAVEQMILAYVDARQDAQINGLLLIACVILDFLCIHPFRDGNGRISRLLTILLLEKAGFDIGKYISVEGKIEEYKGAYYEALRQSSAHWHENKNDYTPFMVNFLQILYYCYKDLDDQFIHNQIKKVKKNERVRILLQNSIVPISKEEVQNKLPDVSIKTIEGVLSKMQKEGQIEKIGSYRDARYIAKRQP